MISFTILSFPPFEMWSYRYSNQFHDQMFFEEEIGYSAKEGFSLHVGYNVL